MAYIRTGSNTIINSSKTALNCSTSNNEHQKLHQSLEDFRKRVPSNPGVHSSCFMRAAGLVYTGDGDTSKCQDCGVEISNWTNDMHPFKTHAAKSPNCPYILNMKGPSSSFTQMPLNATLSSTNELENPSKRQKREETKEIKSISIVYCESELVKQARRRTFSHWPQKMIPSSAQMIEAGFFCCNVGDRVICIYCNLICQQWTPHVDDPCEIHKTLSQKCVYVVNRLMRPHTESIASVDTFATLSSTSFDPLNCDEIIAQTPSHPNYKNEEDREKSFEGNKWKSEVSPLVVDLVRSGFFCTKDERIVTCFHCDGSFTDFTAIDSPLIEHIKYFPHCRYAKKIAGQDFHRRIQDLRHDQESIFANNMVTQIRAMPNRNSDDQLDVTDQSTLSRMITARLDSPISQRLLSLNVKLSIIRRCWEDQLRLKHDDFVSSVDLWLACSILERQLVHSFCSNSTKIINLFVWRERMRSRQTNETTANNENNDAQPNETKNDETETSDEPISQWPDETVEKRIKDICPIADVQSNIVESSGHPKPK